MNYLLAILVVGGCFALMGIGLLVAKKTLRKGCSMDPDDCACRRGEKNPACDNPENI